VATIGFFLVYTTYRWNLLYVYSSERDTRGLHYPRALKQTLAGVYLAEICMVGLFGVKGAYGPLILMFGLIIFTTLIHISLNDALGPLLYILPLTVAAEEALRKSGNSIFNAANLEDMHDANDVLDSELQHTGYDSDFDPSNPTDAVNHGEQSSRGVGVEGADAAIKLTTTTAASFAMKKYESSPIPALITKFDFWTHWISPDPNIKPNFLLKFLHPEIFADYHILRQQVPDDIPEFTYEDSVLRDAYSPPSMRKRSPRIWLPRDVAGISSQEVAHSSKVVEVTDEGAWLDAKGGVSADLEGETSRWVLRDWERVKF
jgi:calcium permeable stress-gated cation channel